MQLYALHLWFTCCNHGVATCNNHLFWSICALYDVNEIA